MGEQASQASFLCFGDLANEHPHTSLCTDGDDGHRRHACRARGGANDAGALADQPESRHGYASSPPPRTRPAPAASQAIPTQLDAVTTAAMRSRRPLEDVPATVSVITTEDIDRENMQDVRDLVRNEPGVTVGNNPTRAGFQNFIIRGIGGNRVLLMVDGMRQPDFPDSNMGAGTYTREQPDLEDIKRVEIIRGPASALYGSDAIGGVVAYTTKDPGDYLKEGRNIYGSVKGAYSGANLQFAETFTGAVRAGDFEFMGMYTRRDGHEYTPAQSSIAPNPTSFYSNDFFAKAVFRPTEVDTIRITGSYTQGQQSTQVLSGTGTFPALFARVFDEWGQDYTNTYRISAQWQHDAPIGFIDKLSLLAYFNSVYMQADTYQLRGATNGAVPSNARTSQFYYTQNVWGGELQMHTDAKIGNTDNYFTYGLSFAYTTTTRPRNRSQITLATGAATTIVGGETYPNKNFPDLDDHSGRHLCAGRDQRPGRPAQDHAWRRARLLQPESQSRPLLLELDRRLPKHDPDGEHLRVGLAQARPALSFLGYLFGLLPVCDGLPRAAVRQRQLRLHQRRVVLPDPAQSQPEARNRQQLRSRHARQVCRRVELAAHRLRELLQQLPGVGRDRHERPGHPLPVQEPQQRHDLGYRSARRISFQRQLVGARLDGLRARHRHEHQSARRLGGPVGKSGTSPLHLQSWHRCPAHRHDDRAAQPGQQPELLPDPAYFNLDATIGYTFKDAVKINAGIFNITNAKYWNAADVIGLASTNQQLDLYAQPGRYFGVNLTARW